MPEHVVYRDLVTEIVVLTSRPGVTTGLNPTGGRFLDALERSETVAEAAEKLATEYKQGQDEITADVLACCSNMLTRGLVELRRG